MLSCASSEWISRELAKQTKQKFIQKWRTKRNERRSAFSRGLCARCFVFLSFDAFKFPSHFEFWIYVHKWQTTLYIAPICACFRVQNVPSKNRRKKWQQNGNKETKQKAIKTVLANCKQCPSLFSFASFIVDCRHFNALNITIARIAGIANSNGGNCVCVFSMTTYIYYMLRSYFVWGNSTM